MSEIINGTSNTGAIEEEYGVIIDGGGNIPCYAITIHGILLGLLIMIISICIM